MLNHVMLYYFLCITNLRSFDRIDPVKEQHSIVFSIRDKNSVVPDQVASSKIFY